MSLLKFIFITSLVLTLTGASVYKLPREVTINWITIQELEKAMGKNKKKVFIDIYTDWCGVCKKMDKNTFQNRIIAKYINKNYHAVKLNAEYKEPIQFKDKEFKFIARGRSGIHEIAEHVAGKQIIGYPTISILDEKLNVLTSAAAYFTPQSIEPILKFFGENAYMDDINKDDILDQKDFEMYKKHFRSSFYK
ncbi:MAG TPA: DUF255 domain-containing protein [Bacteroidetes bacterium]|nr:DUF255 domain-containing protein [Bacteroidota bacterium]